MGWSSGREPCLAQEARPQLAVVGCARDDHLERDRAVELSEGGAVDDPHAAASGDVIHAVAGELHAEQRGHRGPKCRVAAVAPARPERPVVRAEHPVPARRARAARPLRPPLRRRLHHQRPRDRRPRADLAARARQAGLPDRRRDWLHAGEGNAVLEPVVGANSVLLLDEKPHLRQRKLLLPPFHGERMKVYGTLIEDIARAELDGWPLGDLCSSHEPMQRITLRVIARAVFGIEEAGRLEHVEGLLRTTLDRGVTVTMIPRLQTDLGRWSPWARFKAAAGGARRRAVRGDRPRGARHRTWSERDRRPVAPAHCPRRGRQRDDRPGAARRADDDARGRPRDHRHGAGVGLRAPGPAPHSCARVEAREDPTTSTPSVKETLRVRPVLSFAMRRVKAPYRIGRFTLPAGLPDRRLALPRRPAPRGLPRAARLPPRALAGGGAPPETYTWIPFGGGMRRCLGASFALFEMRAVLRTLLERFDLAPAKPGDEGRRRRAITFIPAGGARVLLRRRPDSRPSIDRHGEEALVGDGTRGARRCSRPLRRRLSRLSVAPCAGWAVRTRASLG